MEFAEILRRRTRRFALDTIKFCRTLLRDMERDVMGRQLLKTGTSVGANYRASCCGRSDGEWFSKLCVAREEADESEYWLSILSEIDLGNAAQRKLLLVESQELTRLLSKSIRTFQSERERKRNPPPGQ